MIKNTNMKCDYSKMSSYYFYVFAFLLNVFLHEQKWFLLSKLTSKISENRIKYVRALCCASALLNSWAFGKSFFFIKWFIEMVDKLMRFRADFGRLSSFRCRSNCGHQLFSKPAANLPLTQGGHYQPLELGIVIKV